MKKINKNVIWWIIVLSISFWSLVYWAGGTLWSLFTNISGTYFLMWNSIEPDSIKEAQMSNNFKAKDSDQLDSLDSTAFQREISNSSCVYGINSIADNWAIICTSNNNTDTQLSETIVDSYVSNNGYITSEIDPEVGLNSFNYIPKWNWSSLVKWSIYDNGITINTSWKKVTNVWYSTTLTDAATVWYVNTKVATSWWGQYKLVSCVGSDLYGDDVLCTPNCWAWWSLVSNVLTTGTKDGWWVTVWLCTK